MWLLTTPAPSWIPSCLVLARRLATAFVLPVDESSSSLSSTSSISSSTPPSASSTSSSPASRPLRLFEVALCDCWLKADHFRIALEFLAPAPTVPVGWPTLVLLPIRLRLLVPLADAWLPTAPPLLVTFGVCPAKDTPLRPFFRRRGRYL